MHQLVKIIVNEDGINEDDPQWHLAHDFGEGPRALCTGEVFGEGEGPAVFQTKTVRAGIPCPRCKEMVRWFKAIKL